MPETHEVFTEARPTYTMIDRTGTPAFKRIRNTLKAGGRLIRFYGPSKSGKTLLCRQVYDRFDPVIIHGSTIDSKDELWDSISSKVGVPPKQAGFYCAEQKRPIIIDDFHWINSKTQEAIIRSFKPYIDEGASIVVISVPDVAKEHLEKTRKRTAVDRQLSDLMQRSKPVSPELWTESELGEIATLGFQALNVVIGDGPIRALTKFSFRNPLLMQKHCAELCFQLEIESDFQTETEFSVSEKQLSDTFKQIAEVDGSYFHEICTKGGKRPFDIGTGKKLTLRELLLASITRVNIDQPIGLRRIQKNMRNILKAGTAPDIETLRKCINDLISDVRRSGQISGLVFDQNDRIRIAHPFFKSYMLWKFQDYCGIGAPDLEKYSDLEDNEDD